MGDDKQGERNLRDGETIQLDSAELQTRIAYYKSRAHILVNFYHDSPDDFNKPFFELFTEDPRVATDVPYNVYKFIEDSDVKGRMRQLVAFWLEHGDKDDLISPLSQQVQITIKAKMRLFFERTAYEN